MIPHYFCCWFFHITIIVIIIFAILLFFFQLSFCSADRELVQSDALQLSVFTYVTIWIITVTILYSQWLSELHSIRLEEVRQRTEVLFFWKQWQKWYRILNINFLHTWSCSVLLFVFKNVSTPNQICLSHFKLNYLHFTDWVYSSFSKRKKQISWSMFIRKNFLNLPAPRN